MQPSVLFRLLIGVLLVPFLAGCQVRGFDSIRPALMPANYIGSPGLAMAESACSQAVQLESYSDPACVDLYFQAATLAWPEVAMQVDNYGVPVGPAASVYHASLSRIVSAGQRLGRFDPRRGLEINTGAGSYIVPTTYHGFPWQPGEFDKIIPVDDYSKGELINKYQYAGFGASTMVLHNNSTHEPFRKNQQIFSATILLRPGIDAGRPGESAFVLELYDPSRMSLIVNKGVLVPLARDLTAPIAFRINNTKRDYVKAFIQPGSSSENDGLFMIEPYQRGKIPVVFVHGLLSDPFTWANIANEIRACPEFVERYQLWAFEYATGEPFLKSAAKLRRQLTEAQLTLDPTGTDTALSQVVLVGHSMGGLISNLQITHSGNQVWEAISRCPLENIATTHETQMSLAEKVYFEPSPLVSRVIFVGTPHRGSPFANRPIGKIGASLVEEPSSMEEQHQQLIRDNPGAFSEEFTRRVPTSIELLKSDSPLLLCIDQLPHHGRVQMHTIVGTGYWMMGGGDSDSVVPVSSARKNGVASEKFIHAKHTKLHQNPEGIEELFRILREHLAVSGAYVPSVAK